MRACVRIQAIATNIYSKCSFKCSGCSTDTDSLQYTSRAQQAGVFSEYGFDLITNISIVIVDASLDMLIVEHEQYGSFRS